MAKTLPSGKTLGFQGLQTNAALEYYVRGLPASAKTCELGVRYVSKEKTRRDKRDMSILDSGPLD